jgi:hypothetical protein
MSASGQSLAIVGQVHVRVKIQGFSWPWMFLVSMKLVGQPILRIDFISKTKMVLDIGEYRCHFGFAPEVTITFKSRGKLSGGTHSRQPPRWCRQVGCGELTTHQRRLLQGVIQEYQDVLTDRLGSTHLVEYDIL